MLNSTARRRQRRSRCPRGLSPNGIMTSTCRNPHTPRARVASGVARGGVPISRRDEASFPRVRPIARTPRLGVAAEPVSWVRRYADLPVVPGSGSGTTVRTPPHNVRSGMRPPSWRRHRVRPGDRRPAQACAGALGMEALRLLAVVPPGEPVQRQPASNRGLCDLRSAAGLSIGLRCTTTRRIVTRSNCAASSMSACGVGVRRAPGRTAGRADVDPLARVVEIRRAGVPLLPARHRARDCGRVGRGLAFRVACRPAAGVVTSRDRGGDRHRPRRGLHGGRTGRARLHHGDRRRGVGRLSPAYGARAGRRHRTRPVVGPRQPAERRPRRVVLYRRGRTGHRRPRPVEYASAAATDGD